MGISGKYALYMVLKRRFSPVVKAVDPGFGGVGATNVPSGLFTVGWVFGAV